MRVSPLPSENNMIFLSRRAAPPALRCHRGATSQATKGLAPGGSSCPPTLPAARCGRRPACPLRVYRYSSVAGEPIPTWLSLSLPPHGDPRSSRERQPASHRLGKGVTKRCFQHKWLFRTSRDTTQCFCKCKRNSLACRTMSFAISRV